MPYRTSVILKWFCLPALTVFAASAVLAQTWQPIGPKPIQNAQGVFGAGNPLGPTFNASGRVTAIAPDPATQGRIFVGTANGGLWMITGAGGSTPSASRISDNFPNPTQAIGAVALDPSTSPPTIYVGTGEGNFGNDTYYGRGLFVSTDLGATWTEPFRRLGGLSDSDSALRRSMGLHAGPRCQDARGACGACAISDKSPVRAFAPLEPQLHASRHR